MPIESGFAKVLVAVLVKVAADVHLSAEPVKSDNRPQALVIAAAAVSSPSEHGNVELFGPPRRSPQEQGFYHSIAAKTRRDYHVFGL